MIDKWEQNRGQIYSQKGGWEVGKGITSHGYSLLDDLHGKVSITQLIIMNITGKLPEKRLADFVEGFFICLSWPDPRIWCNKIGVFNAATHSSITAAIASGGLAGDSKIYGAGTAKAVGRFVDLAHQHIVMEKRSVQSFFQTHAYKNGKLFAPGFARPLAKGDERIPAMRRLADHLGYGVGVYLTMLDEMEEYLRQTEGEGQNLAGYFTAFMKDQGFSVQQIEGVAAFAVSGGVYAAYFEYIDQPPHSFLPLRVDDIEYTGPAPREVPDRI